MNIELRYVERFIWGKPLTLPLQKTAWKKTMVLKQMVMI